MKTTFIILAVWFSVIAYVQAEPQTFSSAETQTNLLELYTSEGCSSCPPADHWLSKFKNDDRLWKEFIPVAFHVDYWDYIGWKDKFSTAEYGQRQRIYATGNNLSSIYTPGVMLNGKEWRSLQNKRELNLDKSKLVGKLNIGVDGDQLMANFVSSENKKTAFLNIAILGFNLITTVEAGENNGRKLQHDFVVLGYERMAMNTLEKGYALTTITPKTIEIAPKTGIAAWIDYGKDLSPVQATGGWLVSTN